MEDLLTSHGHGDFISTLPPGARKPPRRGVGIRVRAASTAPLAAEAVGPQQIAGHLGKLVLGWFNDG